MESRSGLRFVDAQSVQSPAGRLGGFAVLDAANAPLGRLDGILVDPRVRRVRGYVVQSSCGSTSHRYLVPAVAARLDRDRHAIAIDLDADAIAGLDELEPQAVPRFSDDDLITALFHGAPRT